MSDFVGEQSRVHIMPISAKWKHKSSIHIGFIVFNGGVTTFFAKSVVRGGVMSSIYPYPPGLLQSYDCSNAIEVTLKDVGKMGL